MAKRNKKHEKRIKKLIVVCMLSAIILTVSTYAWFIGMRTVSVNAFEVEIAAADGLELSVDGVTFSDTVTINGEEGDKDTVGTIKWLKEKYATNTNSWTSLKPVSTIGAMDNDTNGSRMIIYEKSSLTASAGGYRLLSEQLKNYDSSDSNVGEAKGYVAFDLFVKNLSGEKYYATNNPDNEEAIYLTVDSSVSVATSGVKDTGIENSVRVAFAQVGRVKSTADASAVQGITCEDSGSDVTGDNKVTGICRNATIWEPNDTKHIANAIAWYESSCKARTASETFSGTCGEIKDGTQYKTYAVAKTITENKEDDERDYEIDVYDGEGYNGYTASVTNGYLKEVETITDTAKIYTGNSRPTFMTLAPNSITKVRVYIYLEGQDIDNYDFASLGKAISVNFGFTKERYYAEDFGYDNDPDWYEEKEHLYRNYRIKYTATDEVSGLPENVDTSGNDVTYDVGTSTLTIPRTIKEAFEFTDGTKTMVATPTIVADGTIDWTIKEKDSE